MTIDQFITFIYVKDLNKSAAFYRDVLELELWLDQGTCRIYKASSTGLIGVCQSSDISKGLPSTQENSPVILTLVTKDVNGWYKRLKAKGTIIDDPPVYNPQYNIYHFFLNDPDSYLIEIQCFRTDHPRD